MKKLALSFLISILTLFSYSISAKPITAEVKIAELQNIKLASYFWDQIYFTVLETDNKGKSKLRRIPEYPLETPIKKNRKLKDISLWKKDLNEGESVQVIISVVEQDLSKFGSDDLIGQAAVTLSNTNNKLVSTWSVPESDRKHTTKFIHKNDVIMFDMTGDKGDYHITFSH